MNTDLWKAIKLFLGCLLLLILVSYGLGCSATPAKWTTANKVTCAAMWATQIIDGAQYERDKGNPYIEEANPNITDENVWIFKLGTPAIVTIVGHFLPASWRNWIFGGLAVTSTVVIINNEKVKNNADDRAQQ